jgi:hypothetical protein
VRGRGCGSGGGLIARKKSISGSLGGRGHKGSSHPHGPSSSVNNMQHTTHRRSRACGAWGSHPLCSSLDLPHTLWNIGALPCGLQHRPIVPWTDSQLVLPTIPAKFDVHSRELDGPIRPQSQQIPPSPSRPLETVLRQLQYVLRPGSTLFVFSLAPSAPM